MASIFSRLRNNFAAPQQKQVLPDIIYANSFVQPVGKPVWMRRDYGRFAEEAYVRNVIAHRSIAMVAGAISSVPVYVQGQAPQQAMAKLEALLKRPNPLQSYAAFVRSLATYQLISGNGFVQAIGPQGEAPLELHCLRPDRVSVVAGDGGMPKAYQYKVGQKAMNVPVDRITGRCAMLHLKSLHPLDDWYGLSSVEAAAYSIDQHNQAGAWNQALLQHGARPTGALVVNAKESGAHLSQQQYERLRQQIDEQFSGPANAGRPLLLEGGLDWKEMSLSPKDMDFIDAKHSSARDIALAFGVPPQLLGIPGDNTYANLAEARLALWEQTVIPAVEEWLGALNHWLAPMFDSVLSLKADYDEVPALSLRREQLWNRVKDAGFLSDAEKRQMLGFDA